jgi:hypothetical protein
MIIGLLHPYVFLHDMKFESYNSETKVFTWHNNNDIFIIMSLFRVILIVKMLMALTSYLSNRNNRICLMYGFEMDSTVLIKMFTQDSPFVVITLSSLISILVFAYAIRICERPLTDITGDQNFG